MLQKAEHNQRATTTQGLNNSGHPNSRDGMSGVVSYGESIDLYPRYVQEIQTIVQARGRYAPSDVTDEVLRFLSRNLALDCYPNAPRMFLLVGGPGTGKSVTLRSVAEGAGFQIVEIHAAMLESPTAGKPVEYVARKLVEAGEIIAKGGRSVVLIEDIEMALRENTSTSSGTINGDLIRHMLQRYCDDSTSIVGMQCTPAPIAATTNSPADLRESFIRSGRAQQVVFNPQGKDLSRMAWSLLCDHLTKERFLKVRRSTDTWRIAQYRDLANRIEQARSLTQRLDLTLDQLFTPHTDLMSQPVNDTIDERMLTLFIDQISESMKRRTYLNQ